MVLEITQYGDPVLRKKCRKLEEVDETLLELAQNMLETMIDANGVGLAAPQVGEDIRMAVIDVSHDPECVTFLKVNGEDVSMEEVMPLVFINPELELDGPRESDTEGCLSIDNIRANVRRPSIVKAKLQQLDGSVMELETDGLLSRAIQHEVDHLNGILFVDRISPAAKVSVKRKLKRLGSRM
ncbi:MAG: peptide deformylase [Akkermansiaceae bacterium]|jgi:peptide deformylase|tara:strand:+ start:8416 stop:8964 length:549 start_codon:yes stop_codon:yes gene_type:complete